MSDVTLAELSYSFRQFFRFCLRKWWVILLLGLGGGGLGIVYAWTKKPKYTANILFALEDNGGGLSGALSLAAEFGLNLGASNDVFSGDNILTILSSRSMVENVLLTPDTLNGKVQTLAQTYIQLYGLQKAFDSNRRLKGISFRLDQPRNEFSYYHDSALALISSAILKTQLKASRPDRKLNIYAISFTAINERFAKTFAERLLKTTSDFYSNLRSERAKETLRILEERVSILRGGIKTAISGRAAVQDANLNPVFAASQAPLQQKQFEISSYGQAYGELFKNLELARFQYLKSIPLLQEIEPARYPLKFEKPGRMGSGIVGGLIGGIVSLILLLAMYGRWRRNGSAELMQAS